MSSFFWKATRAPSRARINLVAAAKSSTCSAASGGCHVGAFLRRRTDYRTRREDLQGEQIQNRKIAVRAKKWRERKIKELSSNGYCAFYNDFVSRRSKYGLFLHHQPRKRDQPFTS